MYLYLRCLSAAVFFIAVIAAIDGTPASELEQWGVVTKNKATALPAAAPDNADGQPAPVDGRQETGAPAPENHAVKQSTERPAVTPPIATKAPLGFTPAQENKKERGISSSAKINGTPQTALRWESPPPLNPLPHSKRSAKNAPSNARRERWRKAATPTASCAISIISKGWARIVAAPQHRP